METTKLFVRLPATTAEAVAKCANRGHTTRSAVLREALDAYVSGATSLDPQQLLHLYYPRRRGSASTGDRKVSYELALRLPVDLFRAIEERAEERGLPISAYVREAVYAYLALKGS